MKINILSLFFISILLLTSCSKNEESTTSESLETVTPTILVNSKSESRRKVDFFSSGSRSYEVDIIHKLYEEALDKNKELQTLHNRILDMSSIKSDSLAAFNLYKRNNEEYFESVNKYLAQIQDTVLREATRQTFEQLEKSYSGKVNGHLSAKEKLGQRANILNDRLILIKLFITQSMMQNYQNNELPNLKLIEGLLKDYDQLINETKKYVK
jgi:hypothetical protein